MRDLHRAGQRLAQLSTSFCVPSRTAAAIASSTVGSASRRGRSGPCHPRVLILIRKGVSPMIKLAMSLLVASMVLGVAFAPADAAEREQVRIVVNLVAAVKMPYPENLARNRAKTQRVWLDLNGATVACLRLEARRWCFEHIPPVGARAEMLRIRNEALGVSLGALFHYVDDFDL